MAGEMKHQDTKARRHEARQGDSHLVGMAARSPEFA